MTRPLTAALLLCVTTTARGDVFDLYTNPVLAKAVDSNQLIEVQELTPQLLADHDRAVPGVSGTMLVVVTNERRYAKLIAQAARQKVPSGDQVPMLLIDRYATFREGTERQLQANGQNVSIYPGFQFNLDLGQIVPANIGGDLTVPLPPADQPRKLTVKPVGKARLFLVTKPLPEAQPKKGGKLIVGEKFEPAYFNGTFKLYDDGRRSGTLILKVDDVGAVDGAFYSDLDGQKYDVTGKLGPARHAIQFVVKLPRVEQHFTGWLFTGNARAITGSSKMQEREAGFYAVRVEDD